MKKVNKIEKIKLLKSRVGSTEDICGEIASKVNHITNAFNKHLEEHEKSRK